MDYIDLNFGTHQLVLLEILKRVNKPVLELGSGYFSTVQIHDALKDKGIKILTLDDHQEWLDNFLYLKTKNHDFACFNDSEIMDYYKNDNEIWGLVFIDNSIWETRTGALLRYKDTADYVILHDCDYISRTGILGRSIEPPNNDDIVNGLRVNLGTRDYSDLFRWWIEFFIENWNPLSPPTLLGSNKICLDDIIIDGLIISNRNK